MLVSATFLPILDYRDVLYMSASGKCLQSLNVVYHCALRFITGCSRLTHHCELYTLSGWPSLSTRRYMHWMILIYKALLGLVPSHLCSHLLELEAFMPCALRVSFVCLFLVTGLNWVKKSI